MSTLEAIAHDFPNTTTLIDIGKSSEDRDLRVIKIGRKDGKPKRKVWLDAGLHAREWIAPATAMFVVHKVSALKWVRRAATNCFLNTVGH